MKKEQTLFSKKVWEIAASIPRGKVSTYGAIARAAGGGAQSARSVTRILSTPDGPKVPWHRIVYADGTVWLSPKHEKERRALYKKEGIEIDKKGRIKDFFDKLHVF